MVVERVSREGLAEVAARLLGHAREFRVWVFVGEMGAGKTTLIKELCAHLGVTDAMSSPTFSIVNEYRTTSGETVFHFDFYRIQKEQEALDIGAEEYFYSGHYCFIEWPERIPDLIPDKYAVVKITIDDDHHRTISLTPHG